MSTGVTSYQWATKANRLLIPLDGALYVQDGVGDGTAASLRRLFDPTDASWAAVGEGPLLEVRVCGWRPKRVHRVSREATLPQRPQEHAAARAQGNALLDRECRARQLEVRARVLFSPEPESEPEPKSNLDGTRRRRR